MICSPLKLQNRLHPSPWALQLHLLLEHGLSLKQLHLISLSRSAGARGVPWGTLVGKSIVLPSGWYQPWSVGCRTGGVSPESITPDSHGHVSSQGIPSEGRLCRREWTQLWGFHGAPLHLVLPHLNPRHVEGSTVAHGIACQDEGPCFCKQLAVLVHWYGTVPKRRELVESFGSGWHLVCLHGHCSSL